MIPNQPAIDPKLTAAIRTVLFKERGKAPLSVLISSLRNSGWSRLGASDRFAQKCEEAGFKIEHKYKKGDPTTISRTFIVLTE
jgi:hypothetical protein